ncbi:hypothetical protein XAPC_801 [Xanthomonas citri pv. punicae str. LMG 859]|nr:hypothetical protein XAPC_801 [Xanthomonas citri pv. punicae str. LMG 859]
MPQLRREGLPFAAGCGSGPETARAPGPSERLTGVHSGQVATHRLRLPKRQTWARYRNGVEAMVAAFPDVMPGNACSDPAFSSWRSGSRRRTCCKP